MARAAGMVMIAFVLSRVLGLAREMVIARQFGTSLELAAYLAAFRIPDLIFYLIAGGALGSAFIPTFTAQLMAGDREEAWKLASAVFNLIGLVLVALAIVAAIFAPGLARLIVPKFDPATQALTAQLIRVMLIAPVMFGISGLAMGILHSHQHFLTPALAPIFYNLSIILTALLLGPRMGVRALAAGVVIGALLHLVVQVPMLVRVGARYTPAFGLSHPGVREVGRLMGPRILGLAAVQINFVVNTVLASGLGAEALPALSYAWLLTMLPQGIFAVALATVAFPTFSVLAARDDIAGLRHTLSDSLRTVLYLTVPASIGLFALRTPVIAVLLERGAFTATSTAAVAFALQFYALGLFAHATIEIVARAFYALHDTRTPVTIGLITMAVNVVLSLILIGRLSFGGLALANTLATISEMAVLVWVIHRRLGSVDASEMVASMLRIIVAAGVMAVAVLGFARSLPTTDPLQVVIGGIGLGAAVYVGVSILLGSNELGAVLQLVRLSRD